MQTISGKSLLTTTSSRVSFGAGKVKLYSDFDGTYLPASHKTISQAKEISDLPHLDNYFSQVRRFLELNKSAVQFTVTTGRNLGEFHSILNHFRRIGLKMPLPDSVIVKNGGDHYIKRMADEVYYASDSKPYTKPVENKREALKNQIGWDGPSIRSKILKILQGYNFEIRKDPTTNSAEDYGFDSTLYHVTDHFDRDGSESPWISVLRDDGDLKFFIGLPKDMQHRADRKAALADIKNQLDRELKMMCKSPDSSTNFKIHFNPHDSEYGNHPSLTVVPMLKGQELTKLYDTKKAVFDAIDNNNLVITAGDGSNDFEMLNPANYIELPPDLEKRNQTEQFVNDPKAFLKILEKNPDLKRKFDALPFLGIVVERNNSMPKQLKALVEVYSAGSNPKILKVREGELFDGVVKDTLKHLSKNPEFASNVDTELVRSLPEFQKKTFFHYVPEAQIASETKNLKRSASANSFFMEKYNLLKKN